MNKMRFLAALVLITFESRNISCTAFSTKVSPSAKPITPPSTASDYQDETNVNFVDWISDAPNEIKIWKSLSVKGKIPSYVEGTLVRNGSGVWTPGDGDSSQKQMFSHIFDGLAKIHSYRISQSSDDSDEGVRVQHQARFLEGSWYKQYSEGSKEALPFAIGTGPVLDADKQPITGFWRTLRAVFNSIKFDNTPVNIWDYNPKAAQNKKVLTALTDAPPRTSIDFDTMETLSSTTMNPLAKDAKGYELFCTAHPLYSQKPSSSSSAVDTYNVAVELGTSGARVNLVKECTSDTGIDRTVVASFASEDGIPYFHSFGLSQNYAVIVLQPLRVNLSDLGRTIEVGFLRAMLHVDQTRVVVVDLKTREVVMDKSVDEKVYFYHSISTAEIVEEQGDVAVSLRLCAYQTPDQLTGEHQFMRLEQTRRGRQWRNKIHPGGKFCDIVCYLNRQTIYVDWKEEIKQGFELPVTRYSRSYNKEFFPPSTKKAAQPHPSSNKNVFPSPKISEQPHPRYVYAFGAYALGSPDYDCWGLFKFDLEENKIAEYYSEDSVYISEPAFVADPNGESEDDGVLLSHAYFGRDQETKFLVLDAKTMNVLAEAPTGNRAPLDFHGAFIPSKADQ